MIIKYTPIIIKYNSEKTPGEAYEVHLKDIKDSICLAASDSALLAAIRLDLEDALAKVKNMQFNIKLQDGR